MPAKTVMTKKKRPRSGFPWLRWLILLAVIGVVVGVVGVVGIFVYYGSDPDLPHIDRVSDYHPKVVSKIYSADGELVGEVFEERRTVVPIDKIPAVMKNAIIDAEDADFYQHGGLSYWGMARAALRDLKPGARLQGASTLTQQLVRNLILKSTAQTVKRKVQEAILAMRLDGALSKDEILYLYLNQIDLGHQRYGVEEAARFYFGKSIAEVNAGEAALLASLPKGPTEIDPWKHPERAKDRQKYVLSQMLRYKHITEKEAAKYASEPIQVVRTPAPFLGVAPEMTDEVKKVLSEKFGGKRIGNIGIDVVTTCDARIQRLTRDALEKGLIDLDARQGYRKPLAHLKNQQQIAAHEAKLRKEFPDGPGTSKVAEGVVKEVVVGDKSHDSDGAKVGLGAYVGWLPLKVETPTPANPNPAVDRYNPKGLIASQRFSVGDVIRVRQIDAGPGNKMPTLALELGPQAAAVVMDPDTREVKAIVGGYGYRPGGFDRAIAAKRQPGSSFKPFVYAKAFDTGRFTPATVLIDGPQTYASEGMAPWKPQNAEKDEFLGPVRLRVALAKSLNTIASQLVDVERNGVSPADVVQFAHEVGIASELQPNPSLALGASEVTPLELTNAYATFAAGGKRMEPQLIKKIGSEDELEHSATQAMKPELAYLITSMLTSVIEEGTAASIRGKLKRPAAGKTGTVVDAKGKHIDAWFVGYTPDLVVGVWVGYDDRRELGRGEQGARASLPIWSEIMMGALKSVPPKPFAQPPGIVVQRIDPKTGLLAPPGGTGGMEEVFLEGTAPTEVAPTVGEENPDTYIIDQAQ
jgi:penicillin-binding protein 1A